jgi:hypothetical protein
MTTGQRKCDIALENSGGDRALAAVALGKTVRAVEMMIAGCDTLKWKWRGAHGPGANRAPTQAQTIHRPPAMNITDTEKNLVVGMAKEDALLADGLDKLGLTPAESALAVQLSGFNANHFVNSVHIAGAGMTRIGLKLGTQVDELAKRLEEVRAKMKETTSAIQRSEFLEEEKYLLRSYVEMTQQIVRISDSAHRSMLLTAMVRYKLSGRRSGEFKMPKPGYSASLPIDATSNGEPNQP